MTEQIATLKGVTKRYREFTLNGIDFDIPAGCIIGIIGPNGAGKTTTLELLMNMIKLDGGEITIFGQRYPHAEKEIKNKIGYVGEVQYFYEDRTVGWTGKFVSNFYANWNENEFDTLLMRFGLSRTKKVKNLSKGMRVKLAFAIALAHFPKLIILDEPTSGLDPVVRREVLELLKERSLQDETLSILISSHITDDLERIADIIHYMINGQIALSGEKDLLLDTWKKIHFKADIVNEGMLAGLRNIERNMFGVSGITNQFGTFQRQYAEAIQRGDIRVENIRLDDILISLLEK
jgi:ABC-2 type transport system ATP-binding protein